MKRKEDLLGPSSPRRRGRGRAGLDTQKRPRPASLPPRRPGQPCDLPFAAVRPRQDASLGRSPGRTAGGASPGSADRRRLRTWRRFRRPSGRGGGGGEGVGWVEGGDARAVEPLATASTATSPALGRPGDPLLPLLFLLDRPLLSSPLSPLSPRRGPLGDRGPGETPGNKARDGEPGGQGPLSEPRRAHRCERTAPTTHLRRTSWGNRRGTASRAPAMPAGEGAGNGPSGRPTCPRGSRDGPLLEGRGGTPFTRPPAKGTKVSCLVAEGPAVVQGVGGRT